MAVGYHVVNDPVQVIVLDLILFQVESLDIGECLLFRLGLCLLSLTYIDLVHKWRLNFVKIGQFHAIIGAWLYSETLKFIKVDPLLLAALPLTYVFEVRKWIVYRLIFNVNLGLILRLIF